MDSGGAIDYAAFAKLVDFHVEAGTAQHDQAAVLALVAEEDLDPFEADLLLEGSDYHLIRPGRRLYHLSEGVRRKGGRDHGKKDHGS